MGHHIIHTTVDLDVDREELRRSIVEEADMNGDGWFGSIKWEDGVYASLEAADSYLSQYDGRYESVAVKFRDLDAAEPTDKVKKARSALSRAEKALSDHVSKSSARNRPVESVSCPVCGSRIMIHKMRGGSASRCPVCLQGDLRTKTAIRREAELRSAVEKASSALEVVKRTELAKCAPIKWRVKYEYHV